MIPDWYAAGYKQNFPVEEYRRRLIEQRGRCGSCGCQFGSLEWMSSDWSKCQVAQPEQHVLCGECLDIVRRFRNDPDRLRSAIAYLERDA